MALIHQEASEDFPEKSAGRATLSSVDFNMVIWGVGWGCWGDGGGFWGGTVGAEPSGGIRWCFGGCWGGGGCFWGGAVDAGPLSSKSVLMSLDSGLGTRYNP